MAAPSNAHQANMIQPARFSIGLTGGIGCGKTTVADYFATLGAAIIDADQIAHDLTGPNGPAMPAIAASFGIDFVLPDGAMDRAKMRDRVFSDPREKSRLEAILHPLIGSETQRAADAAVGDYLIFVVPLLIESGRWRDMVDRILVVDCPESLQIERVVRRSRLSVARIQSIMDAQVPRAVRLAAADDVLLNDGESRSLFHQIDALHAKYQKFAFEFRKNRSQRL